MTVTQAGRSAAGADLAVLSWLGSALGVPAVSLGVDAFGQSGAVADRYRAHDLDAGSIVNAALAALSLR